jgi:hypothetical protein
MLDPFSRLMYLNDSEQYIYHLTENKLRVEATRLMLFTEKIFIYSNARI